MPVSNGLVKFLGLVGTFAFAACGLTSCHKNADGVPRDQLLGELLSTVCGAAVTCCSAASLEIDNQRCHDDVVTKMGLTIQDSQLAYDGVQAEQCLNEMTKSVQGCERVDYTPCLEAFQGPNLPPGGSCTSALDCARGPWGHAVCTREHLCVQPNRGAMGQPCAYSCTDSPAGADCTSLFMQTDPPEQIGCHSWDGLTCVGGDKPPTCQPLTGADCRGKGEEACPGGYCDTSTGSCIPATPPGGPCSTIECGASGYCNAGTCQAAKPVNGLCAEAPECLSHRCVQGLCAPYSKVAAQMCFDRTPSN